TWPPTHARPGTLRAVESTNDTGVFVACAHAEPATAPVTPRDASAAARIRRTARRIGGTSSSSGAGSAPASNYSTPRGGKSSPDGSGARPSPSLTVNHFIERAPPRTRDRRQRPIGRVAECDESHA